MVLFRNIPTGNLNRTQVKQFIGDNCPNHRVSSSNNIDSIFQQYDLDKNGRLSNDEMKLLMRDFNMESSTEQKDDETKGKNIIDGIGGLIGSLGSTALGIFAATKMGKGEQE